MFVSRSLKDFSASCSWAASSSNSFSHPSAVHFLFPLLFVVSLSSPPPPCCRQHSVLAVLSVEHELRLWKKRKLCAFCYSFPSLEWSLWLFYLLLLLSPMTFSRLPIDSLAYRILVSLLWQRLFQYAIVLVYSVLRCILFVSAFERDSGQTAGQTGGSSVEAYWCGMKRCLELIG